MNMKNVITGAFVGTMVMNLLMPIVFTKGLNTNESLILYSLPLVGALSSLVLEIEKNDNNFIRNSIQNRKINREINVNLDNEHIKGNIISILGKNIKIRTYSGALIEGILKGVEDSLLVLSSAKRLDIPESIANTILFIDKRDIREIEVINENLITRI